MIRKKSKRPRSSAIAPEVEPECENDLPLMPLEATPEPVKAVEPVELSNRFLLNRAHAHFYKRFGFETESRPFLVCRHDTNASDVMSVLQTEWKFKVPRIVLLLVCDIGPLGEWTNPRQLENFKKGLIKAANTTHMWIFSNGLNLGIAKEVGDAVADEISRRRARKCYKHPDRKNENKPPLTLVGLSREDLLLSPERFANSEGADVNIQIEANKPEENRYELNPDHSHYVIVRDDTIHKTGINQFTLRFERVLAALGARTTSTADTEGSTHKLVQRQASAISMQLPLVAILIQGDYSNSKFIFDRLQKELPILVFEGTGGLADLLAFVYDEVQRRGPNCWDAEFMEEFVKPELAAMICGQQPIYSEQVQARNAYRDKVLEIIRLACHKQQGAHLTVVYTRNQSCNLFELDQVLLKALFKSQRSEQTMWYSQLKKDLQLTLDWNSPHVALAEVFQKDNSNKFQIDSGMFMEALLTKDREEFVDIFLKRRFQLSKFLSKGRLIQIYRKVLYDEFFRRVCWEGALGNTPFQTYRIADDFIEYELNWLIELTTGLPEYINEEELSMAAAGMCTGDDAAAERRALVVLTLWAVFTNKRTLTKVLWKHSDQPIHLALILSMAYTRLSYYVRDPVTRDELSEAATEFSDIATGVLDKSYMDANCRAYDILSEVSSEWGNQTAVDIAAIGKNMTFLAHPCCQKWITNLFMGRISIRDLTWGPVGIPQWIKIVLCAYLVFPMYLFIRFKKDPHQMEDPPGIVDDSDDDCSDDVPLTVKNGGTSTKQRAMSLFRKQRHKEKESEGFPHLWTMIYLMWSAPITKFWTFQIFYIIYLTIFSLAVIMPSCGDFYLDAVVCLWTFLIALETCRRTYILHRKYTSVPLLLRCFEIGFQFSFVFLYAWSRLFRNADIVSPLSPYNAKVLQCLGLLYSYYRQIVIYLPISPTLGPLLYRVKLMVMEDFVNFMRMALLVMISGGIVVQATMYPDHQWNWDLARRTVYRAVFSLFLTPVTELGDFKAPSNACSIIAKKKDECLAVSPWSLTSLDEPPLDGLEVDDGSLCPIRGFWPYVFSIQYLVLLKLILMTLLYALFSNTARRIEAASDNIWKFQRYQLVIDFINRLCLPPPLNIISYTVILFDLTVGNLYRYFKRCCCGLASKSRTIDASALPVPILPANMARDGNYEYWRQVAQDYWVGRMEDEHEEKHKKDEMDRLEKVLDEIDNHRDTLKVLRGEMRELHRLVTQSRNYLAEVKHSSETQSTVDGVSAIDSRTAHFLSKSSPYPATKVLRFPVPDKYVPWEVLWMDYDPIVFTKPRNFFSNDLQMELDVDILQLKAEQQQIPKYQWNGAFVSPAGVTTDRTSWITEHNHSIVYLIEPEAVPRNPYGRTGLRGKGGLLRWGPNHYVLLVISRWQTSKVHLVGGKGLEVVLLRATRTGHFSLPGQFIGGDELYNWLKVLFRSNGEFEVEFPTESDGIKKFFQSMARPAADSEVSLDDSVKCEIVEKGYMDDPLNTDNCWKEVELWSIHYTPEAQESLQNHFQKELTWHLVNDDLYPKIASGQSVLLSKVAKNIQSNFSLS